METDIMVKQAFITTNNPDRNSETRYGTLSLFFRPPLMMSISVLFYAPNCPNQIAMLLQSLAPNVAAPATHTAHSTAHKLGNSAN